MRVGIGSDHRGFKLKNFLIDFLREKKIVVVDFGTYSSDSCDYPDFIYPLGVAIRERKIDKGIFICYTGIGSCICANKIKGVRAGLVYNLKTAKLSRKHNNTNVLVLGAGFLKREYAKKIVWVWLNTGFEGGRHLRRLRKILRIEEEESV